MSKSVLEIKHYTKIYAQGEKAVDDVSLTVLEGDVYGFIGPNGAGKTTTLRGVVGVMDFEGGEILIDGHSVKKEPVLCKSVTAYIPDNPDLYDYITGIQYLNYMGDMFRVESAERKRQIEKYGDAFELTGSLGNLIGSYSHGMRQKLALIGGFLHKPRLLVLDEPFVGLDPEASYKLKGFMAELCEQGSAIFFSTHVLEVAEKLCSKIAIIKDGRLVVSGDTDQVRGNNSLEQTFLEVAEHDS